MSASTGTTRFVPSALLVLGAFLAGCDSSWQAPLPRTAARVAPATQPHPEEVPLDRSGIEPIHQDLLAIDLPTVARVAQARSIDIQAARQRVEASHGQYAASIGSALPEFVPAVGFDFHQGGARAVQGQVVRADFVSLQPAAALQWVVNPGGVIYDIVASRRRLQASQQEELAVGLRKLQSAAVQYYELCLAQAGVATALEAQKDAEELVRLVGLRLKTGRALPADDWRAQAALAGRTQDLLLAVNQFYHASVELATTLRLDSSVTLVPRPDRLRSVTLVREELSIDALLEIAVRNRPDLKGAGDLVAAAEADRSAVAWGGLGPTVAAGYEIGGLTSRAGGQSFGMRGEQAASAGAGARIGPAIVGELQTARARQRLADLEVQRVLDRLRAEVVQAVKDTHAYDKVIPLAARQVQAAGEALRQAQASFNVGRALFLDVLDAQNALADARLRYAQAIARYNEAQVNLSAALGVLDADSLQDPAAPGSSPGATTIAAPVAATMPAEPAAEVPHK